MKKLRIIIYFVLFLVSCSSQRTSTHLPVNRDAEVIKQLEYEAISAEFRLDTALISQVLHPDFIAVYPHKIQNKQQELYGIYKNIVQRKQDEETMDSLYLDDFRAHIYGNAAVVTFHTVTKGRRKTGTYENQRWRWYDVWIKDKGNWKLVSAQGTPVMNSSLTDTGTLRKEIIKASDEYLIIVKVLHNKSLPDSTRMRLIESAGNKLAAEYEYTDAEGKTYNKKDDLEYYRNPPLELALTEASGRKVKISGSHTAVESGVLEFTGTNKGKPFVYKKKYTTTWIFRDGRWQIFADHASEIK